MRVLLLPCGGLSILVFIFNKILFTKMIKAVFLSYSYWRPIVPIASSIIPENTAKPAHPKHMATGPCRAARTAPVTHPPATGLTISCFALLFSITHSIPAYTAPTAPKFLPHRLLFLIVECQLSIICQRIGTLGGSGTPGSPTGGAMELYCAEL